MLGPTVVGALNFRQSNLFLCFICLVPTLIAVTSIFWKKRETNTKGTSADGYNYNSSDSELPPADIVGLPKEETGESFTVLLSAEEGQASTAASAPQTVSNPLRVAFACFYFIYVGLETGFGGSISTHTYINV